jgi:BRCT domain type II-containing protein
MEEENIHMEEDNIRTYSKRPYQSVKKLETTDADSSESAPSAVVQRANINERVARLLSTVTKSERDNIDIEADNIDMEEDNIDMEEDNIYSKQSTWSSGWSDSISCSERVVDIDRVARLLEDISKLEGDNIGMEEDNTEMEEDNIGTYRKNHISL